MSDDDIRPLGGLRILDLTTGIAGPYATKLFVDAGAGDDRVELRCVDRDTVLIGGPGNDLIRGGSDRGVM